MSTTAPSIRDLARSLGLSHTTVSQGLRNHPSIKLETRERIQAAAKASGYRPNALTSTLMTGMRRRRGHAFSGTLAIVDIDGAYGNIDTLPAYRRELIEGAFDRAIALGFIPKYFAFGSGGLCWSTYDVVFKSHDICGVLILPCAAPAVLSEFDWSRYAMAYAGHGIAQTPFNCIGSDPHSIMREALRGLHEAGYRRPGLVLKEGRENHLLNRWGDAYWASLNNGAATPILLAPKSESLSFSNWFTQHNPDVVLSNDASVMDWMLACSATIPATHGFFCLNKTPDLTCAGFDQQPRLIGTRSIEQVIAQLQRNEFGKPDFPLSTIVPGHWVDGPTVQRH